ncbi:unnamed protein product [Hymenolepis diminuta]|uniref:Secreted protein n=1 Tax=Hymenolepis diminuta TaxID=6216 RepID=A0A0R3SY93_HYMDI|nr:unnamed protein product [Hymenolepis diminuta]
MGVWSYSGLAQVSSKTQLIVQASSTSYFTRQPRHRRGNRFLPVPPMTKTLESGILTAAHRDLSSIVGGRSNHLEGGSNTFILLRSPSDIMTNGK